MLKDSVRADGPPEQDVGLVPDRMALIDNGWRSDDRVNLYLYVDRLRGDGRLIAFAGQGPAVTAGTITDANGKFLLDWTGELDRPTTWQNAQRAIAYARYKKPVLEEYDDEEEP